MEPIQSTLYFNQAFMMVLLEATEQKVILSTRLMLEINLLKSFEFSSTFTRKYYL